MTKSYRFTAALATLALAAGGTTAFADSGHGADGQTNEGHGGTALRADLFGSQLTGPVLFNVPPGGAPWVIDKGSAVVRRDGRVKVSVKGLVIPTPPSNGTNPVARIAATVYCNGDPVGTTQAVPFSLAGDARIDQSLGTPLPRPCLVPAVLLNPATADGVIATGNYIAATGA